MLYHKMAKEFALSAHGKQKHGCLDISEHLENVARLTSMHFGDTNRKYEQNQDAAVSAAWMHDVLEDTDVQIPTLDKMFSEDIVNLVIALTDHRGRNRRDRHLRTYWHIRDCPVATLIKLCDRFHNQQRSLAYGERWIMMYAQEFERFSFAFWRPREYEHLWASLFKQQKEMQKFLEF